MDNIPANVDDYLSSRAFLLFLDEELRKHACDAADDFLTGNAPVENTQLRAIPAVIQANGLIALKDLAENQKRKSTKEKNRKFWEFVHDLVFAEQGPDLSLRSLIQNLPEVRKFLKNETDAIGKQEQKKIRKENRAQVNRIIDSVLPVYFEHFNCHYFYMTNK